MDEMKQSRVRSTRREPMFNVPPVVLGLIAVIILISAGMASIDDDHATDILLAYGFVPADWASWFGIDALTPIVEAARLHPQDQHLADLAALASFLKLHPGHGPVTALTYAFLHGGFEHVAINSVWLLAFGAAVARRLGTIRFLGLYLLSAVGGAVLHFAVHPSDLMPLVGASGAISGIMAAAVRFMFQPGEALSGFAFPPGAVIRLPPTPLKRLLRDQRPRQFILLWLGINLLTGLVGSLVMSGIGSIAWEAHLGGFLVGLFAFALFDPPVVLPSDEQISLHERQS